ncbi:MAG: DUF1284 domain-containing protein [Lachnospiraceae bacterium]|nr:DUF1284 domain-containing protein [Lachnospiraceae bacterium]
MTTTLRPHHGMCFQFYEGKGYSEEFTDHMGKVIQAMEADPQQKICLKTETDVVCANCPNRKGDECESQEQVLRYDEGVLKACNLTAGQELSYGAFIAVVREKIIEAGLREKICGDCCWNEICRRHENAKATNP